MARAIPLSTPDGIVMTYACGACWNVASTATRMAGRDPEDIATEAEYARRNAECCCRCRLCDKVTGPADNMHRCCADCLPRAEREHEERLDKWREQRIQESEAREQTLKSSLDRDAALALEQEMRDISENCYCAGWLNTLEFDLWSFCLNGPGEYGMGTVDGADIGKLKGLSEKAGGWWRHEAFVPIAEWLKIYGARNGS